MGEKARGVLCFFLSLKVQESICDVTQETIVYFTFPWALNIFFSEQQPLDAQTNRPPSLYEHGGENENCLIHRGASVAALGDNRGAPLCCLSAVLMACVLFSFNLQVSLSTLCDTEYVA